MRERPKKVALASDFDGTIYFMMEDPPYRKEDLEKIKEFQAAGGLFGACSGRSLDGIRLVANKDDLKFDFYILATGALVLDAHCNRIFKKCIPYELMAKLYREYENSLFIVVQANETVYSLMENTPLLAHIESLEEMVGADIYGLSFGTDSPETAIRIAKQVNDEYGDELTAFSNVRNVDIVPKGCSKGHAIQIVRDYYGIDYLAGIGDSYNDIPMLENVDHAFTFNSSPQAVKDKARDLVDTAAEAVDILLSIQE